MKIDKLNEKSICKNNYYWKKISWNDKMINDKSDKKPQIK